MSGYAENWASTPWAPEPLEAVQHLRSLLCATSEEQRDQNVPQKILDNIEEKIKAHCKYKHLVHVEHQRDAATGRNLVRMWKCVTIDHYTDFGYAPYHCPERGYYDWQKIVVNIWIKKTWRTTTSWQMITKNETEQNLLLSQETTSDPPLSGATDIPTMMEDQATESCALETQEVNIKVQGIMSTVRDTFPRDPRDCDRTRSRSPRGEASQASAQNTLQAPFGTIDSSDLAMVITPVRVFVAKKTDVVRKLVQDIPYSYRGRSTDI